MPQRCLVILVITMLLLCGASLGTASGQKRTSPSPKTAIPPAPAPKEDKWWAAQRSLAAVMQQLETYLRENPNGTRAATPGSSWQRCRVFQSVLRVLSG
jgi:hypothetical protein